MAGYQSNQTRTRLGLIFLLAADGRLRGPCAWNRDPAGAREAAAMPEKGNKMRFP